MLCKQDPLDRLLGNEEDDDEFAARRPAPTIVKVGPEPRASRRRRPLVAQPNPEEVESFEEVQQTDEVLPRRTQRGRSQRHAARALRRDHEDLGVDEEEAIAMALAASLADASEGSISRDESAAADEINESEVATADRHDTSTGRAARRQPAKAVGTLRKPAARRGASRKRVVHVDPITGQRIRAPRFPRPINKTVTAQSTGCEEMPKMQESSEDEETAAESDEEQPTAEAVAAENERHAREQMLAERLGRTLAAPVAAPSPLKPFARSRPTSAVSLDSPDLMRSSPAELSGSESPSYASPAQVKPQEQSPASVSAMDTSAGGEQDLMSRLQQRLRGSKATTTARQSATPLQEREQNRQDSLQLADDM